jgi:hypothetical protein
MRTQRGQAVPFDGARQAKRSAATHGKGAALPQQLVQQAGNGGGGVVAQHAGEGRQAL